MHSLKTIQLSHRRYLLALALLTIRASLSQGRVALQVRHPLPEHLLEEPAKPNGAKRC